MTETQKAVEEDAPEGAFFSTEESDEPEGNGRDYDAEAATDGWSPKESWRGDPDRWVDAKTFVERGEKILPIVQAKVERLKEELDKKDREFADRLSRMENVHRGMTKKREKVLIDRIADLEGKRKEAIENADGDSFQKADTEIQSAREELTSTTQEANAPPPEVVEWAESNKAWFQVNPAMTGAAESIGNNLRAMYPGDSAASILERVDVEMKSAFPDYFAPKNQNRGRPAKTEGATTRASKSGSSFNDLPAEAKAAYANYAEMFKDQGEDYSKDAYLKDYYGDDE